MKEKLMKICEAGRLCEVCRFSIQCYDRGWRHDDTIDTPCAVEMPEGWVDESLVDKVYNAIIHGAPKFVTGQWVKYSVNGEVRYNKVIGSVWNPHASAWLYKLEEPLAMPIHREQALKPMSAKEVDKLKEACEAGKCIYWRSGYLTVEGGL